MRKSTRSEIRMLREMMWHFGLITKCHFCNEPLLEFTGGSGMDFPEFGERNCPPVKTVLTIHHENEDHGDDRPKNRKPCHQTCHKRYHMKLRHKRRKRGQ
jgi:hypothetical protein